MQRYEHPYLGALVHLDIKKLARFRVPGHRETGQPRNDRLGARIECTLTDTGEIPAAELPQWVFHKYCHRRYDGMGG